MPASKPHNTSNPASGRMAEEFPRLWELAKEADSAERLGGTPTPIQEEADRAMREIWDARRNAAEAKVRRLEEQLKAYALALSEIVLLADEAVEHYNDLGMADVARRALSNPARRA